MLTADEKHAFAQRLLLALKRSKKKIDGPAALALQFNLRHHNESITPQAAYKWLHGIALPSPDKINTLAEWLNVSPHWLRFGPPDAAKAGRAASKRSPDDCFAESGPPTGGKDGCMCHRLCALAGAPGFREASSGLL